jgi:Glucose-6-phosphate isomerase
MTARHFDITTTKQWHKLGEQAKEIGQRRIEDFLHDDASRAERYSVSEGGLYLDYAKNLIDDKVFSTFFELLDQSPLAAYRSAMFSGEIINSSEQRPVLHAALRSSPSRLAADGLSHLSSAIEAQKARVKELSDRIRNGQWLGTTGKPVTDLVNLGIGGSDLGPRLVCDALKEFAHDGVRCHFVSNVDGEVIASTLKSLNPETTLVVISSKTFTTQETLLNARSAARWFTERLGLDNPFNSPHFIGVTASPDNALKLGLPADNLLEFWDWVGGRLFTVVHHRVFNFGECWI